MKTFDIPGGTASFREKDELTVGGSRAVALATRKLPRSALLPSAKEAGLVEADSETDLEVAVNAAVEDATDLLGFPVGLSDEDIEAAWAYNDTLLVAYLGEWTLSRPLPRSREDLEDLPSDIYAALNEAIAKHITPAKAAAAVDGFSVDAVEDADSPTGA